MVRQRAQGGDSGERLGYRGGDEALILGHLGVTDTEMLLKVEKELDVESKTELRTEDVVRVYERLIKKECEEGMMLRLMAALKGPDSKDPKSTSEEEVRRWVKLFAPSIKED